MRNQSHPRIPWNKGKLVGQKAPLTQQQIWSLRIRLETAGNPRNLALFNLAIDSKLRACDLLSLQVSDIANGLMALPNLIALLALSGVVVQATRDYMSRPHTRR